MKITILTLFPAMIEGFINESIIKRAQEKGAVEIEIVNFRDFTTDAHKTVDQSPYGGGAGMVLMVEPIVKALRSLKLEGNKKIALTSAKGDVYNQAKALEYSTLDHIVIIAGHYEGFDERISDYIDEEISLGDFVMTGGEITAVAVLDSVVRLLPGVLKKEGATEQESFYKVPLEDLIKAVGVDETLKRLKEAGKTEVQLVEYPHYTRPEIFEDKKIPDILLSGHHKEIEKWRLQQSYSETIKRRPDLLDK